MKTFGRSLCLLALMLGQAVLVTAQTTVRTLNDGWLFRRGDAAENQWQRVAVPHTWNTDAYQLKDYYRGEGTYLRTLRTDSLLGDRHVFLKIDAACQSATVFVNDWQAGFHRGGYSAFTVDITPYLNAGADNTLRILVDNADPDAAPASADFTFMGGIYRDVWLITTPDTHFDLTDYGTDGVHVITGDVSAQSGKISVRSRLRNEGTASSAVTLRHTVYAPDGHLVCQMAKRLKLAAGATQVSEINLPAIQNPVLWSPERPSLYKVVSVLLDKNNQELQRTVHQTGFRWCSFDADKGFFLNGQPYKLRGMCIHQDQKPYGVAVDDDMHRRDVTMMKEMGANFVRLAHYQQDDAILEQCDKQGLLVWEEIPVVNSVPESDAFADAAEVNLREMIRQHRNHPSVILWGYMNEILLQTNRIYRGEAHDQAITRILSLANRLEKVLKEEDPSRHSTMAFHGTDEYNKYGISKVTDVVGWNLYQGWYGGDLTGFERFLAEQHERQPDHPMIVSEWGAGSDQRLHSLSGRPFDFSLEYQQRYIEHYLPVMEQTPYVCGGSYWNFIDFSSAGRDESMPRINNKGVVYADRTPKDVFYYFKALWRNDVPVLHIASRDWTDRVSAETTMPVKVYTNLREVELLADGNSLGKRPVENGIAVFDVPFWTGETLLRAVGTYQEKTVEDAVKVRFRSLAETASGKVEIAVNVGSQCYYVSPKSQLTWLPDQPYREGGWGHVGGQPKSTQGEIFGTDEGPLYQTWREGIEAYQFDVPQGRYEVELLYTGVGREQGGSVYLLGRGGNDTRQAFRQRMIVDHVGGVLAIPFPDHDIPSALSGIKIRQL